jgi:cellulose synthase/poly-beta-1,6-N-acetylglucosamine synthase-like glycosyltransferase
VEDTAATHHLDATPAPHHWSYRVVGLLAWSILGLSILGASVYPRLFLTIARLFAFFLLARLVLTVAFYMIGAAHCRRREGRETSTDRCGYLHHVVIIPNYREPMEVLSRTLRGLAAQEDAKHYLTVVLAMEEREVGAREKARVLQQSFKDRFARLLVTVHPANLSGEVAGKGANQAWAARWARRELVDRLELPIEELTLTSCDADSVLHPRYFAELAHLFNRDPERHRRFWYAPVFYYNNIWRIPAAIRLLAYHSCALRMGELANPSFWSLPVSTYTLSFKLADEAGYWDPGVISEDWHMYLRCFFAAQGRTSLTPIFLPTQTDAVEGETLGQTLANYYRQQLRHSWGAEDVGYILQQWRRSPDTPLLKKLLCFLWILHLNLLRSTSWFIIVLGSLTAWLTHSTLLISLPKQPLLSDLIPILNALGIASAAAIWAMEHVRCPPTKDSRLNALAQESIAWGFLPILSFAFAALPALHAQTKLLLGSPLAFQRTPKKLAVDGVVRDLAAPPSV